MSESAPTYDPQPQERASRRMKKLGTALLKKVKVFAVGDFDPQVAFPEVFAEQIKNGASIPVFYSGPLYTGEGAEEALQRHDADLANLTTMGESDETAIAKIDATLF